MLLAKAEPLYLKLKSKLQKLIDSHDLKVLPGTKELEKRYGVSRITVRRAIAELAKEGVVSTSQGRKVMVTKYMCPDVKELGFVMSKKSSWGKSIFSYFVQEAFSGNYNLNMFINALSDSITSNHIFSYLLESNKLSGLFLMNRLCEDDLKYLLGKKIPLLTYNFKYRNYDIPAALFDYEPSFSKMMNHYLKLGKSRFAFLTFYEEEDDPAYGEGHGFIVTSQKLLRKHNLVDYKIPERFKHDTERKKIAYKAMCYLHSLPEAQRPELIVTCFYSEYAVAHEYISKVDDWNPIIIPCRENPLKQPYLACSYKKMVETLFRGFTAKIDDTGIVKEDILIPTSFEIQ